MTPELKAACELVFQEHKTSGYPINWSKDAFRGRISFGLAALAKQTLERRNIICAPNPAKKTITVLNAKVIAAASFEEAEEMIQNKVSLLVADRANDQPSSYVTHSISSFVNPRTDYTDRLVKIANKSVIATVDIKWWMKPLFYYIIWPVCALIAGGFIAWILASLSA